MRKETYITMKWQEYKGLSRDIYKSVKQYLDAIEDQNRTKETRDGGLLATIHIAMGI